MRYIVVASIVFGLPLLFASCLYALDHLCERCD